MKKTKAILIKNRLFSLIMALMFAMSCFQALGINSYAASFEVDGLNNRANTSGTSKRIYCSSQ